MIPYEPPAFPPPPPRPDRRSPGRKILDDLADAPEKLRNLADWHDMKDDQAVIEVPADHREVQADLRRWADAIKHMVDFPWWVAVVKIGLALAVAYFAGVVTMMVAVR